MRDYQYAGKSRNLYPSLSAGIRHSSEKESNRSEKTRKANKLTGSANADPHSINGGNECKHQSTYQQLYLTGK